MCEVTVIRGYYCAKMGVQYDFRYSLGFSNETVFLEETMLWCIFFNHSQGKGMTNVAMQYLVFYVRVE